MRMACEYPENLGQQEQMFWGIMGCWKKKIPTWQDMLKLKKIKEGVCESNSAA